MEQIPNRDVASPLATRIKGERETKNRRAPESENLRVRLCDALAPIMSRMSTEQVRLALRDVDPTHTRADIARVKRRDVSELGWERLLWMCRGMGVSAERAIAGAKLQ